VARIKDNLQPVGQKDQWSAVSNGFRVHEEGRSGARAALTGPLSSPAEERSHGRFSFLAHPWQVRLLGTVVAAACATATYALVIGLTGSPLHAASASPHPAATSAFSYLPQRCALLSTAIVAEYLPGTTCNSSAFEDPGGTDSRALWSSTGLSASGDRFDSDVDVMLMPPSLIEDDFDSSKSGETVTSGSQTIHDSRPVTGLGNEAYIVFETSSGSSKTSLVVEDDNALINIDYDASVHDQAASEAQAEKAVLAMARDIIKQLH
jgi:hypothetical protein